MDFVADALFDGRRFRALRVLDNFTKESLAIEVDGQLKGENVVAVMERLKHQRACHSGSRRTWQRVHLAGSGYRWAYDHQVTLDYSRPGKPTDNLFIE